MPQGQPAKYIQAAAQALSLLGAELERQGYPDDVLDDVRELVAGIKELVSILGAGQGQQQPPPERKQSLGDALSRMAPGQQPY
jgi:hypothetical protein